MKTFVLKKAENSDQIKPSQNKMYKLLAIKRKSNLFLVHRIDEQL